jgi:thymidylate synthase (FAD)
MENGYTINVLDKGFVRYIDHLGTDQRILESARISYKAPSKGKEQDKKLLFYLYRNKHTSPFEQCNITFNIKMPIFIMRQFVRHRTFRINEASLRYTESTDDFYMPTIWRKQDLKSKQSSFIDEDWNLVKYGETNHEFFTNLLRARCQEAYETYKQMIDLGVAKEMARMILPINLYTEIYVNCDLHNLLHFIRLRTHQHAQLEIQTYANAMFEILKELYPWTAEAYQKYRFEAIDVEKN